MASTFMMTLNRVNNLLAQKGRDYKTFFFYFWLRAVSSWLRSLQIETYSYTNNEMLQMDWSNFGYRNRYFRLLPLWTEGR